MSHGWEGSGKPARTGRGRETSEGEGERRARARASTSESAGGTSEGIVAAER